MNKLLFSLAVVALFFLFILPDNSLAYNATISIAPREASVSKEFTVAVNIDGGGEVFNASRATISLSDSLQVKELVLGDCNFSFITTPSERDPSFEGMLLGRSSKKCTVYTLQLIPIKKGEGSITISNATIRKFGDASDILKDVKNGKYTLTSELPAIQTIKQETLGENYTVSIKVISTDSSKVVVKKVTLVPAESSESFENTTGNNGVATFENLKRGIYVLGVEGERETKIINVNGKTQYLSFSITLQKEENPLLEYLPIIGLVTAIIVSFVLIIIFLRKRRNK